MMSFSVHETSFQWQRIESFSVLRFLFYGTLKQIPGKVKREINSLIVKADRVRNGKIIIIIPLVTSLSVTVK